MKKYIIAIAMVAAGMLVGVSALAATLITLSPTAVSVKTGQTFTVAVSANPQGVKNYTVEVKLNYPADLLQVKSFTFGSQWMALNQPGYDLIDNTNGVLIKTAGYPQGFISNARFGTITFQAKKTGSGVVALANGTVALDQSNQNVFAGSSQVTVSVATAPVATATPKTTVVPGQPIESPTTVETTTLVPSAQQTTLSGNISNVFGLGTGNWLVALIVILAIAFGAYWLIKRTLRK